MPYLLVRDVGSGHTREFELSTVRLGRAPGCELLIAGEGSEVSSANHARLSFRGGHWWVEDTGSRNGTYLGDRRIGRGVPERVAQGDVVGVGETGPRFMIDATEKLQLDKTVDEMQGYAPASAPTVPMEGLPPAPDPPAPRPPASAPPIPSPPTVRLILRELRTGEEYQVSGGRIRIGRGDECELQPLSPGDTSVSRVHAEVVLRPDGTVVVRDARSRNGTLVNGTPITADYDLKKGDRLMLGQGGPELLVEHVSVSGRGPARAPEPPGDERHLPRRRRCPPSHRGGASGAKARRSSSGRSSRPIKRVPPACAGSSGRSC